MERFAYTILYYTAHLPNFRYWLVVRWRLGLRACSFYVWDGFNAVCPVLSCRVRLKSLETRTGRVEFEMLGHIADCMALSRWMCFFFHEGFIDSSRCHFLGAQCVEL